MSSQSRGQISKFFEPHMAQDLRSALCQFLLHWGTQCVSALQGKNSQVSTKRHTEVCIDFWGFRERTSQRALFLLIPTSLNANAGILTLGRVGINCVSTKTEERFLASQSVKCEERLGVESYILDDGQWPQWVETGSDW